MPWAAEPASLGDMAKKADSPTSYVARLSLVGRSHGAVKNLAGFKKPHHTVPDNVSAATTAFLGKLCAAELREEGEQLYQQTKVALGYKRTQLTLEVASPTAVLTTQHFTLELAYALEPSDPATYVVTRTLHHLRHVGLVEKPEFDVLFARMFSGIVFGLAKGVRVEAVIDVIEALDGDNDLTVNYPSDCRHCVLSVESVEANVMCDGALLEMRFPENGSPRELLAAFAAVRSAFALTKNRVLAGLL